MVLVPRDAVSSSSLKLLRLRLPLVRTYFHQFLCLSHLLTLALLPTTAKFQQYMYGGRPLGKSLFCSRSVLATDLFVLANSDVRFNDRWHTFTPTAAKGGQVAPMQSDGM